MLLTRRALVPADCLERISMKLCGKVYTLQVECTIVVACHRGRQVSIGHGSDLQVLVRQSSLGRNHARCKLTTRMTRSCEVKAQELVGAYEVAMRYTRQPQEPNAELYVHASV